MICSEPLASKTVVWTAGVTASLAGQWLEADVDRAGRVKVLPDMSVPGYANVFVIGDTAFMTQGGKPLPGVAQVAMQQGTYVASIIRQRVESGKTESTHAAVPFHYHDKGNLATVGRSFGVGYRTCSSPIISRLTWLVVHIFS
jgi:NADH dehydrogenase